MAIGLKSSLHHLEAPWHPAWHAVERGFRAAMLLLAGFLAGALIATATSPYVAEAISAHAEAQAAAARPIPELAPEWRWQRDAVSHDDMYRRGAETRSLDHMYRAPR